jgi:hypothetical protein
VRDQYQTWSARKVTRGTKKIRCQRCDPPVGVGSSSAIAAMMSCPWSETMNAKATSARARRLKRIGRRKT